MELLRRLKDKFPSQFAGVKDSSHDAELARQFGEVFGSDLVVLTGTDSYLQLAIQNKAAGCITAPANILSPDLREVWEAMKEGRDSTEAQARVKKQRDVLDAYPPFPPTLKTLMHRLYGFPRWSVRPPLESLTEEVEARVVQEFEALKL